jgi:hypothetical protein
MFAPLFARLAVPTAECGPQRDDVPAYRLLLVHGETRTRTGDTTIFSRVLYQLSYLAEPGEG